MVDERPGDEVRLTAWVQGRVQGRGFRDWTRRRAGELGLRGSANNLPDGRVAIVAEGERARCAALLSLLRGDQTPGSVTQVLHRWAEPIGEPDGFWIG